MAAKKQTIRRVKPSVLTNDFTNTSDDEPLPPGPNSPLYPVDEVYPRPPKSSPSMRFAAVVDPYIALSEEAKRRIEKTLRQAVLAEIAQLDFGGDVILRSIGGGDLRNRAVCC